ncbi:MAG: hypothetical protein K2H38_01705 [Muribaculaceae bacterium]|nr:hypothetical protein [Muribaculaceae bacterium]
MGRRFPNRPDPTQSYSKNRLSSPYVAPYSLINASGNLLPSIIAPMVMPMSIFISTPWSGPMKAASSPTMLMKATQTISPINAFKYSIISLSPVISYLSFASST